MKHTHTFLGLVTRNAVRSITAGVMALGLAVGAAKAASSWSPTLLVNTESFQTIDEGDGTTNIQIKFGQNLQESLTYDRTLKKFEFSRGLSVAGNLTATGSITASGTIRTPGTLTGGSLTIDHNANIAGKLAASGSIRTSNDLSGATLHIQGAAAIHGTLSATGAIRTESGLYLNSKNPAADSILSFGDSTAAQTLKYMHSLQKFVFSTNVNVKGNLSGSSLTIDHNANIAGNLTSSGSIKAKGNLSGSTLTVDGNLTLHGITYSAPTSITSNGYLKTDAGGNLTWSTVSTTVGNGSGGIIDMQPQYPNAVYFASGSTDIGQMTQSGGTAGLENVYRWTSTKTTKNDYWIGVRVRVPDNFVSWINTSARKPIELRYRTGSGQSVGQGQGSYVTIKMTDTTGAPVTLTGGANLANTSYTTASITGPDSAGTWTKGGYFNIWIKMAASTTPNGNWFSEVGYLNIDWLTSTP